MGIQRIYWDASVFHALFSKESSRVEKCERVVKAAQSDTVQIFTSAISYTECLWLKESGVVRRLNREDEEVIRKFFEHKFIRPVACDRTVGEDARLLCWKFPKLRPKDAIHVASALLARVDALHSYDDDDFIPLNGQLGDPPLRICHPGDENNFTLTAK